MTDQNWEVVIDGIQTFMIWFLIFVISVCILSLILFDVLVGAGVMIYLTNNNIMAAIFISLATSGLLMALMIIGGTPQTKKDSRGVGVIVLILAVLVYGLDVYFDCLTADYLRYGKIVVLSQVDSTHLYFRGLLGGISTVGESLAVAIILGMPVLKTIIANALPNKVTKSTKKNKPVPPILRNVPRAETRNASKPKRRKPKTQRSADDNQRPWR